MEAILYKNLSENNVIGKELQEIERFNLYFKDLVNLNNPSLRLELDIKNKEYLYLYLTEIDKYYFVTRVTHVNKNLYDFDCECDVLETYKDEILNSYATYDIAIKQNDFNSNVSLENEIIRDIDVFKSDVILKNDDKYILSTIVGK